MSDIRRHMNALYRELKRILPRREYQALVLKRLYGFSGKEIAYKLGVSESRVSQILKSARDKIRKALEQEEGA